MHNNIDTVIYKLKSLISIWILIKSQLFYKVSNQFLSQKNATIFCGRRKILATNINSATDSSNCRKIVYSYSNIKKLNSFTVGCLFLLESFSFYVMHNQQFKPPFIFYTANNTVLLLYFLQLRIKSFFYILYS